MLRTLAIAFICCFTCYLVSPLIDPDLWWHLTVGRWILAHQSLPIVDNWNRFALGHSWVAYSWSVEVLYAMAYRFAAEQGLVILKLLSVGAVLFSAANSFTRTSRSGLIGTSLATMLGVGLLSFLSLRPQIISWISLLWLLPLARSVHDEGLNAQRAFGIFLLMMLWGNTHLSTALGIAAIFFWSFSFERPRWRGTLGAVLAGIVGSLITPYHGREWLVAFHKADHPFQLDWIAEFTQANILDWSSCILLLFACVLALLAHYRPDAVRIAALLGACLFTLGGLLIVKFLPYALILFAALIAEVWGSGGPFGNFGHALRLAEARLSRQSTAALKLASLVLIAIAAVNVWQVFRSPIDRNSLIPTDAVSYTLQENLPRPLLSTFGAGGYLMHRLSDDAGVVSEPVALDGRTNVNDPALMHDYYLALNGRIGWRQLIEKTNPGTIIWRKQSALPALLLETREWRIAYQDPPEKDPNGFVVFVRSGGLAPAAVNSEKPSLGPGPK